jgi:hypothetical protein
VSSSTRTPHCPRCRTLVEVKVPTFLMLDTSAYAARAAGGKK